MILSKMKLSAFSHSLFADTRRDLGAYECRSHAKSLVTKLAYPSFSMEKKVGKIVGKIV
jgi:hypothetical protein